MAQIVNSSYNDVIWKLTFLQPFQPRTFRKATLKEWSLFDSLKNYKIFFQFFFDDCFYWSQYLFIYRPIIQLSTLR